MNMAGMLTSKTTYNSSKIPKSQEIVMYREILNLPENPQVLGNFRISAFLFELHQI